MVDQMFGLRLTSRTNAVLLASILLSGVVLFGGGGSAGATTVFSSNNGTFSGTSCWSASACVTVGQNEVNPVFSQALVATTSDGGGSWTSQSVATLPYQLPQDVSCPVANTCFMVSEGTVAPMGPSVFKSTDGGSSWSLVAGPAAFNGDSFLTHITCSTSSSCVALGQGGTGVQPWFTTDGGLTWVEYQIPGIYETTVESISCWGAGSCLLVGQPTFQQSWDQAVVFSTTDNGVTWVPEVAPAYNLATVSCYGPSTCAVTGQSAGGAGLISTTTNAGASWVTATPGPLSGGSVHRTFVMSCSSSVCAVGTGGTLLMGQGASWSVHAPPAPMTAIDSISCPTGSADCALGGHGANVPGGLGSNTPPIASTTADSTATPLPGPVVGMASTPTGDGYWLADAAGGVSAHGAAQLYGSMAGLPLNSPISHIVATADGKGYWLVAGDGGTFSFGDAQFFGSMGAAHLNAPVVDMAPTSDDRGYWLVASDGGIFSFGDAVFHGSMGAQRLNKPVVGIADDTATGGYWEVASDGGIFSFDAPFFGSTGALSLNKPIVSMAPAAGGSGYWFVASDGGVFSFGSSAFRGSMGGSTLNAPIVGMASDVATNGYWLAGADGGIFTFGAPFYGAD